MRRVTLVLISVIAVCAGTLCAASEPVIGVGDTVEISVLGMPDLQKRAIVNESGMISYPLLGTIKAEGYSQEQLRQSLVDQLVNGALLKDPKIAVEIVARPPVYVTGDVMKPGPQPYIPNMTIRGSIALAGGVMPAGFQGSLNATGPGDTKSQIETLSFDFIRQRAHLLRLEAESTGQATVEFDTFPNLPVSEEVTSKLNALERQDFETRRAQTIQEKAYLRLMIDKVNEQLSALALRRKTQEDSIRDREDELVKFKGLADRGIVVQGRVQDEQRSILVLKDGFYDSVGSEAQATRLLEEYKHKLYTIDQERRLSVIKELQDSYIATAAIESRLATTQKVVASGRPDPTETIVIFRRKDGAQVRIEADEASDVLPGDIIEIGTVASTTLAAH